MFNSVYKNVDRSEGAVLISFFGGDEYYYRAADRLASQCRKWGVSHDICEYVPGPKEGWKEVCKKKVEFYAAKLREHQRAVLWVDVDAQIIGDPRSVMNSSADIAAFLRNFKYFIGFDPMQYARLFHPGYLFFAYNERTLDFMAKLEEAVAKSPEGATDDYVFHEVLREYEGHLRFELLPPHFMVTSNESELRGKAIFQHADSGNVQEHLGTAVQHEVGVLAVARQTRVLRAAAHDAIKEGALGDAAVFLRRIRRVDPEDRDSLLKILSIYARLGEEKKYRYHLEKAKKIPEVRSAALRADIERRLLAKDYVGAERTAALLKKDGKKEDIGFIESRMFRYGLDRRAEEAGIPDEARVPLWWWEQPYPGNLGDIVNPYIIEKITGVPPKFSTKSPRVLAIGSIIKFAKDRDSIWGAGAPSDVTPINKNAKYCVVRGPLTRKLVLDAGVDCPEVYGDPAWLLPLIYQPPVLRKTHRLGVIRHWVHSKVDLKLDDDVRDISIIRCGYKQIEQFIDELLSCEAVLSTSLHGVIIANAYGVPAKLCTVTDSVRQIHGDGRKFDDYFLSIGKSDVQPLDLSALPRITSNMAKLCVDNPIKPINVAALLDAAPFKVLDSVRKAARKLG